jgi:UDP-N-acetylmuramate--alanine ligase
VGGKKGTPGLMLRPREDGWLPEHFGRVHLIGVGGSGMSGVARILRERGYQVTGSDRAASEVTEALEDIGVRVHIGHHSDFLATTDTVISTYAIRDHHPEIVEATERGLPIVHRADALRYISRGKRLVAIAGSHGKTTSTAMLATALHRTGIDAGCVNGGVVSEWGASSRHGEADWFVIEADESDRSFVIYDTEVVMVTNIAPDHLDFYGNVEAIFDAFREFVTTARGDAVVCVDDEGVRTLLETIPDEGLLRYGVSEDADVRLVSWESAPVASGVVSYAGAEASFRLDVPGRLTALNATGVIATMVAMGLSLDDAAVAVSGFRGADRRFQFHGEVGGVRVFDDHAHHPSEVKAALEVGHAVAGTGRVITMFQPHLFTRTQLMADQLAAAFSTGSDHTVFLDIFGAREDPIEGVTTQLILDQMSQGSSWDFEPDWDLACDAAIRAAAPGDIILTMSTGDLYQIVPKLLSRMREVLDGD